MKNKKINIILLIFSILFISTGYSIAGELNDKDNGLIFGKVLDNDTKKGVENAVIKIVNSDLQTLSDKNGEFKFENLKYDTYRFEISVLGNESPRINICLTN